jgi:hypothetical protein
VLTSFVMIMHSFKIATEGHEYVEEDACILDSFCYLFLLIIDIFGYL